MTVEARRRFPWAWLLLGVGLLAIGRYLFDDTVTETSFRVGLGLVAVGAMWLLAERTLLRVDDRTVVERSGPTTSSTSSTSRSPTAERFTLPPGRFTLPPGGAAPEVPAAPHHPAPVHPAPAESAPASVAPAAASAYVAPAFAPTTDLLIPTADTASFEDPDATLMVRSDDVLD